MATETYAGPLGEVRAASTAAGGTALSTTADLIGLPEGTRFVQLTTRNYSTAVVAKVALVPYLLVLKTQDDSASFTDYSSAAQDNDTATSVSLDSQDTAAEGDFLYVGSHLPFRGVDIDVEQANGNANVVTVKYWNGSAWGDISDTDGTISSSKSMAQDGQVTWSIPADWAADSLVDIGDTSASTIHVRTQDIYWTRWEFDAALDSNVELDHMLAMSRSTAYAELIAGQTLEASVTMGPAGIGGVEALTNAGTANLIVNCFTRSGPARFA